MAADAPIPNTLTPDELEALFGVLDGRSKTALRNRAMLMVLHDAALRSAEVVKLRPVDIDVAAGSVNVREGKGGKSRLITKCLHRDTQQALSAWLTRREGLGWDGRSAVLFGVFYTRPERGSGDNRAECKGGRALDTSYLRRLLPKLAAEAKITKAIAPHLLRHTRARQWSDMGVPVADIQDALGHKSLETTHIYLRKIAPAGMGADKHDRNSLDALETIGMSK